MAYSRMMPVLAGFVAMAVSTASLAASPIARAGFGPDAVGFDFGSAAVNATTATDGFLTVSNGRVLNVGSVGPLSGNSYYDGADDASGIRFSFATPVSAVGTDFIANAPTLRSACTTPPIS